MRRVNLKFVCEWVISAIAAVAISSCSDKENPTQNDTINVSQQVGFYAGGSQTKTEMLENGLSTVWVADDVIAMWAKNSSGSFALSNQKFRTYGIDSSKGFFTADLPSAMADDSYTYYCCYPAPVSVSGSKVTFNLSANQDGKVSGGTDIMVATPAKHGALKPVTDQIDHSGLSMQMNRMMHQFRFFVDDASNKLNGDGIKTMQLTFPSAVVGAVTLDYTDPSVAPTLSSGSSKITLALKEPITSAANNFACVSLVPSKFNSGDKLQIKAYTSDKIVTIDPIDLRARNFEAGHSTPVRLVIKEVSDYKYKITFKVAANNLGEGVNTIVLTAPSGCQWVEGGSNEYAYTPGRKINAGEEFVFRFESEAQYRAFSGKTISVKYDSDNALTYQTFAFPDMSSVNTVTTSLTVPYLFYQDFSGIPSFSDGHDNPSVGGNSDTYKGISELSSYSLNGWYASRVGGQAGTAVRICCRFEDVVGVSAYYKGRIYTPFLSNLKDGSAVNISVSFRYGGNINEANYFWSPAPKEKPIMYFGINTESNVTNPDATEGGLIEDITNLYGGIGYASWADTSMNPIAIRAENIPNSGGSYTSFAGTKNVTISNVDNGMRLGWIVTTDNTEDSTNGNYWLYLDDIKVQIAN